MKTLNEVKQGDTVHRYLAGVHHMELNVTEVTDDRIVCGPWEFCRKTGAEIDVDLGWGPPPQVTGSYITTEPMAPHRGQT